MAASSIQNPAAATEPKVAKKKKVKVARTESPAPPASAAAPSEKAVSVAPQDANGDESEPAYLRELSKNIRNVNKKLTNASKTDSLIAEHKDKSLEELVSLKIINADQRAQHLKKPALAAQLAQLEEQHSQFKKLDADYRQRLLSDKAELTKTLTEKLEKEKTEAVGAATAAATAEAKQKLHDSLLAVSQFLRLAAMRRVDEQNAQLDENLALEGILLQVYSGDDSAVATMLKLVNGADEAAKSITNDTLQTTFAQVKAAMAAAAPSNAVEEVAEEAAPETAPEAAKIESDPTVAHASLTEIEAGDDAALTNGQSAEAQAEAETAHTNGITNAGVADEAANAAGEGQWDTNGNKDLSMSQEWVEVPRDPAETDTGLAATPAAPANTQSWADEQPDTPPPAPATTASAAPATAVPETNDGFHQVQRHNRARSERDGWRGGRGGGFRGRGGRGGAGGEGRGGRGGEGRGRGGRGRGGHNGGHNGGSNGSNANNANANAPGGNGGNGGNHHRGPRRNEEQ